MCLIQTQSGQFMRVNMNTCVSIIFCVFTSLRKLSHVHTRLSIPLLFEMWLAGGVGVLVK